MGALRGAAPNVLAGKRRASVRFTGVVRRPVAATCKWNWPTPSSIDDRRYDSVILTTSGPIQTDPFPPHTVHGTDWL